MRRKIIQINEERCNGCGQCVSVCAEAALKVVNGKAILLKEFYCDGLGACLDVCPVGALKVVEKDSDDYDAVKTIDHVKKARGEEAIKNVHGYHNQKEGKIVVKKSCACPGSASKDLSDGGCCQSGGGCSSGGGSNSELTQWPIQLKLISPEAPYFTNADIVISADCAPFAYAKFHDRFLKGKKLIILCPKLDTDQEIYIAKLTELFTNQNIRSVTVVRMEVPCCGGVEDIVEEALNRSGVNVLIKEYTLSLQGEIV